MSNRGSPEGSVSAFSINATTGALTPISGSPFVTLADAGPSLLTVDPQAKYLYVPLSGTNTLAGFEIGSTGALSEISGASVSVGAEPNSVVVAPSGDFLYSADYKGGDISVFSIAASSGALAPVSGSPVTVACNPAQLAINVSGTLLFVNCAGSLTIPVYSVGSSGGLTAITPLTGGATAGGIVLVRQTST